MNESPTRNKSVLTALALAVAAIPIAFGANRAAAQGDELTPIVHVPAQYPLRALQRGDSGTVTLRFTIDVDGATKDIEVVESTSKQFEQPAITALRKWRFAPQIENGNPIEKRGIQTVIRFEPH